MTHFETIDLTGVVGGESLNKDWQRAYTTSVFSYEIESNRTDYAYCVSELQRRGFSFDQWKTACNPDSVPVSSPKPATSSPYPRSPSFSEAEQGRYR